MLKSSKSHFFLPHPYLVGPLVFKASTHEAGRFCLVGYSSSVPGVDGLASFEVVEFLWFVTWDMKITWNSFHLVKLGCLVLCSSICFAGNKEGEPLCSLQCKASDLLFFFLISGEIPLLKQFCEENLARLVFSSYSCSAKMRYYLIWEFPSFNDSFFLLLIWEIAVVKTHRISRHWVIQQLHNFNQNADFYAVSINSYTSENTVLEMCMYVRLSADAFISVVLFFQVLIDQEKERRGGTWMSCLYTYISCL